MLVSLAIINLQIIHEEFKMIVDEKKYYDNQEETIIKGELNGNIKIKKYNDLFLCIIKWQVLHKKHGRQMEQK